MAEVPVRRTPWATRDLLAAYATAWRTVIGGELSHYALALLWGQASIECSRGGTSCYGFNVGNLMAGTLWQGDYHILRSAPECYDPDKVPPGAAVLLRTNIKCPPGKVAAIPPGGSRFRAYESLLEGCTDKIRAFAAIWPAAILALRDAETDADAATFIRALLSPRYFTASEVTYLANVRSLAAECVSTVPAGDWPPPPSSHPPPARTFDTQPTEGAAEGPFRDGFLATLADNPNVASATDRSETDTDPSASPQGRKSSSRRLAAVVATDPDGEDEGPGAA